MFISYNNELHMELALMALAASPTAEDACQFLQEEHNVQATPAKLLNIARVQKERYEEIRAKVAPFKEKMLVHNLMDNALYASEVTSVSMQMLMERLQEDRIPAQFLSRVARDVADVQAKAIDKKLSLEGRPTVITENRSPAEIIGALERLGVMQPAKQVQITQGECVDVGD